MVHSLRYSRGVSGSRALTFYLKRGDFMRYSRKVIAGGHGGKSDLRYDRRALNMSEAECMVLSRTVSCRKAERSTWVTSRVQVLPPNRETTKERHCEKKKIQNALLRMQTSPTHSTPILARLCKDPLAN